MIPWDPDSTIHIDDIYTTLSWVRDDRKPSGVTQKELEEYTDIFKGNEHYPNPKRILVYGQPGIGKTTFSIRTSFDWAKQRKEILKKFDVVLLIKLRDVCDLKDICDVLRASKLLAGEEVVSVDDVYKYILDNQEKVLLILDGYDEYLCTGESPVLEIWKGALLTDIHVIITTRKENADKLRAGKQVQFEINGFKGDDQLTAFVSKVLRYEEKVKEFVTYVDQRHLKDLAEIPLFLSMLCTVWNENCFEELPKSRAHICQNFVLTLIHHAITKDAKADEEEDVNFDVLELYKVELCALGKLAFDALLQNALSFPFGKLPDSILSGKFIKFGLFHALNAATVLKREKHVHFIHKSVQEYFAAFSLKEELLKEGSTSCLSEVDSFEKIVKMTEVLRFACELSVDAACAVLSHLDIVGKKEGLTEYNFTETPCIKDLSDDQQQFLILISHSFFSCSAEKRRDLYHMFLSHVGGVLLIDSDQLHSLANEHFLKSAVAPEFIFFPSGLRTEQSYQDLIRVLKDLNAVVVSCFGKKWKASHFLKKYSLSSVEVFLKKEEGKIYLYIAEIEVSSLTWSTFPIEMITELISSPESTQKKPVDDQSNEQDGSSALCLTKNSTDDTRATHHCLSFVWKILGYVQERQEIKILIDILPFVTSPQDINIIGGGGASDPVLVDTLVSHINFTNRLHGLVLPHINLTAKPAAVIARSLYQAPNLRNLDLSLNPLGEGVSDLTRHLSCAPDLETLHLVDVKMTKKQVSDLTEAVRQTKIRELLTSYHVSFVIFVTIPFNSLPEYWILLRFCFGNLFCFLQIKIAINQSKLFFLVRFRL